MARGMPAVWSAVVSSPFIFGGAYVYVRNPSEFVPPVVGLPIAGFGVFVVLLGLYIHYLAAPSQPRMRDGEELLDTRNPAQRAALGKIVVGFALLGAAAYLLFFTFQPYVFPSVAFVPGLYLLSTGLHTYWTNTLTKYYITNERIIKEFRFISLVKQEIPFTKVRGVEERKSIWEALVGLGNVRVASGGGGSLQIGIDNIYRHGQFADQIREYI